MLSLHLNMLLYSIHAYAISDSLLCLLFVFQSWLRETYMKNTVRTSEYQL